MSFTSIQTILDTQLQTVSGLPTFYPENTLHEPKTGVAYSRATLSPAETERLSNQKVLLNGLYLIDLFYPANKGSATAGTMGDAVLAVFERGVVLTDNTTTVHITRSWREVSQIQNQFYQIQIVVRWNCEK